ncbi:hypothetical protein EST38_g11484 [Candolleomyces aberdarensis]|uniref:Uncharacterized protein n=1 Tax=Candolleomyces aberdarensis TaxID=2316362 RepID=A0A4Q2D723_9AGAR|nr:hypothetical protein EST38_g11484 [Candolleomyces aberdarensis]
MSLDSNHPFPRGQYEDGSLYYSPNSPNDMTLRLHPNLKGENPFKPQPPLRSDVRYPDLLQPMPFTKPFYWISFIPLKHWFKTCPYPPIRSLSRFPEISYHDDAQKPGYRVNPTNPWTQLETDVYKAVTALRNKFSLPCVLPFLPNALSYLNTYEKKAQLIHVLQETREWFSVWFGALSYSIAMALSRQEETEGLKFSGYPNWRRVLMDEGFSESWIDDLVHSPVCQFDLTVSRVGGIFDDLVDEDLPLPSWFLRFGIPFWYPWRDSDEVLATMKDSQFLSVWRPRIPPFFQLPPSEPIVPSPEHATAREPEWIEFFRKREARYPHIQETETPIDRQRRENRMRDPPVRSAKVFEWWPKDDGWVRVPVLAKYRPDILAEYGRHQKRYDPYFNEWDCCDEFGDRDPDSDSDDDFDSRTPTPEPSSANHAPPCADFDSPLPANPPLPSAPAELDPPPDMFQAGEVSADSSSMKPIEQEVEDVFGKYYGFCLPVVGTAFPDLTVLDRSVEWFHRLLGLSRDELTDNAYFSTMHYRTTQLFVDSLTGVKPAVPSLSDLDDSALSPVRFTPRFRCIVRLDVSEGQRNPDCLDNMRYLYVFNFQHPTVPWKLAVPSSIAALLICRLPASYTENSIAFYLAQRGVPFRILSPNPLIPRLVSTKVHHTIPIRRFDHIFDQEDYDAYLNHRTFLLSMPHMQASLRRGGIVWRLAIGMLGLSDVVRGPTQWGEILLVNESQEFRLIEDTLSTIELDLICGAYECISGDVFFYTSFSETDLSQMTERIVLLNLGGPLLDTTRKKNAAKTMGIGLVDKNRGTRTGFKPFEILNPILSP